MTNTAEATAQKSLETDHLVITSDDVGVRIDKLLADRFSTYSRSYFQYLIDAGCILVNGMKVKKRTLPKEGDEIEVFFQLTPEISLEPENIPLDILFEDEHILAVNKPAGMVVHPAPGHPNKTFVNALLHHCKDIVSLDDPLRPGIVHRLDRQTSGVLIAAKTRQAHQKLISLFSQRKMEKIYLAICSGRPPNTTVNAPLGRHPIRRKEMAVLNTGGKEAVTHIQVLAVSEKASLVMIRPKTGRTHQIRVHLKHLKTPVLGDEVYGTAQINSSFKLQRHMLHAYRLKFIHPITNLPTTILAPIPDDMKKFLHNSLKLSTETSLSS